MLLAADYASIDHYSGKLNVLGAFDRIYAQDFPTRHHAMHLVIKLGAELGEFGDTRKLIVKLMDEDANELLVIPMDFQVPNPSSGARPEVNAIVELRDVEFPKPGRYEFRIFVDKDLKGDLRLDLEKVQLPQSPQGE